jgi:3-phosphoshikimate 1-carboxyvinyltransferase
MSVVAETIEIKTVSHPIDAMVRLPGSKSYTNRALIVAALATGRSRIEGALESDDTRYMLAALRDLGIRAERENGGADILVEGTSGRIVATSGDLYIGNAGTAARFLVALVALGAGTYRIDGVPRMRERPIGPLLDALRQLGVDARSERGNDCPPVRIASSGMAGGTVSIEGGISSQFISALMLVGPCTPSGIKLNIEGNLVSKPYVDLTTSIMESFGVVVENDSYRRITVLGGQSYRGRTYQVEPDASSASYFLAAAAVTGGRVRVEALGRRSAQGDLGLVGILEQMGCTVHWGDDYVELTGPTALTGIDIDMAGMSDVAQTLAAIAPFATGDVHIRGVGHIRTKETDRVAAVTSELRRLGATVEERPDGWDISPSALHGGVVETYDDHRMAMSFAVAGLKVPGIKIANPTCVAKTFPDFFERLDAATQPNT